MIFSANSKSQPIQIYKGMMADKRFYKTLTSASEAEKLIDVTSVSV